MRFERWTNPSLPQTLQIGVLLLYIDAFFGVLYGFVFAFPLGTAVVVGFALAGLGIANEMRWAWVLGIVVSVIDVLFIVASGQYAGLGIINLLFAVALVALLVHPQSREYQKIWFH